MHRYLEESSGAPLTVDQTGRSNERMAYARVWVAVALVVALLSVECTHAESLANGSSASSGGERTTTTTLSECQVCALHGDCSHAYLDGPGQFCGNWLDQLNQRQRCCCPRDATCKVSNYACKCSRSNASDDSDSTVPLWASVVGTVLSLFVVAGVVACCCWCCCRPHPQPRVEGVVYGAAAPVYASPGVSYGAPGVVHGYGHDYDAGSSAALGVGAGLLGGMLVGAAIADAGDSGFDGGYDGGGDGGGGDFGGDF